MTWGEWVNSGYNTGGYYISGSSVKIYNLTVVGATGTPQWVDTIILNNATYGTTVGGGGGSD